jgi:biopolymer transport protein ExbB
MPTLAVGMWWRIWEACPRQAWAWHPQTCASNKEKTLHKIGRVMLLLFVMGCLHPALETRAQGPEGYPPAAAPDGSAAEAGSGQSVGEILAAGGLVGLFIILLSIAAVALVIEHVMTIRAKVLMPPGLADEVRELLTAGRLGEARETCRGEPCLLGHVLGAGLAEVDGGWPAVEKAMEDATAEQSARLFRKIEYLSVIGNIAPMLGLLGTVIGMIVAFREVADTQGAARAADLAEGIYLALVTTVEGLVVAIPALAAFAVFRNRVDQLVAEAAYVAQHAVAPVKQVRSVQTARVPQPPPMGGTG